MNPEKPRAGNVPQIETIKTINVPTLEKLQDKFFGITGAHEQELNRALNRVSLATLEQYRAKPTILSYLNDQGKALVQKNIEGLVSATDSKKQKEYADAIAVLLRDA